MDLLNGISWCQLVLLNGIILVSVLVVTLVFIIYLLIKKQLNEYKQQINKYEQQIKKYEQKKEQLVKKYEQKKDVEFQLKESLKDAQHKWELDTLRLQQSLEKTKLDYLYATKKLSARGAFELFQNRYVFRNKGNKKTAREMWDLFIEEDNMGKEIKKKLEEANCNTPVGEIAARVNGALCEGIHNYFSEGLRKVYLVKTEFRRCDLIFLQNIYSALPLSPSDVVVLDNKSQFLYSPPRKT